MASYSFGRAPAQSSATLMGEYRTASPERLNSIHLAMISSFPPRDTSIRMSESTRTVISYVADPDGYRREGSLCNAPHPPGQNGSFEFQRIPASLRFAHPVWGGNAPGPPRERAQT